MSGWTHPYAHRQDPFHRSVFAGSWEQAQTYCNFPVLRPRVLPEGCQELDLQIRPEGGGGQDWSSVRLTLGGAGRRLRIKQFLWDWCEPWSDTNLQGAGHLATLLSGDVAWWGTDYKGNQAACLGRLRTQVELSVLEGSFAHNELAALLDSLSPVDPLVVPGLLAAPLHEISYSIRARRAHWGAEDFAGLHWRRPADPEEEGTAADSRRWAGTPVPAGFVLESVGSRTWPDGGAEVQLIWRHPDQGTDMLWLRAVPPAAARRRAVRRPGAGTATGSHAP